MVRAAKTPANDVVLTLYPLSAGFRERLGEINGSAPRLLTVSDLRRLSYIEAARELRTMRGRRCLLPFEGDENMTARPLLESVAALAGARLVTSISADGRIAADRTRLQALRGLGPVVRATAGGQVALRRAQRQLRTLDETRAEAHLGPGRTILYLNGNLWLGLKAGGSIGHVAGVVNAFAQAEFGVELATVVAPIGVDAAVRVRRLEPPNVFALPVEVNHYRFQSQMVPRLESVEPSALRFVYQRMSLGNYAGVLFSRRHGLPLVLEYNGSEVWAARHWGSGLRYSSLATAAEEVCLRHAHVVVTVSEPLRDELEERGVAPERIVSHPNGVDPDIFAPGRFTETERSALRARLGLTSSDVVAGFIGTFGAWHGAEVLARAAALLAEENRDTVEQGRLRILFIGDGPRLGEVRRIVGESSAEPYVRFTGLVPQADAPAYLDACDVLVSPHVANPDGTRFFGSPTKLFEYMAAGKAIVASELDQIGEVLHVALRADHLPTGDPTGDTRERAVLTRPGEADEISQSLAFLVRHARWREHLGANARAEVLARYTWRHHVDAVLAGVERVCSPRR